MKKLDLLKKMENFMIKYNELFNDCFISEWVSDLCDILLDDFGIPEDNSIKMIEKYGNEAINKKGYFCRDYWYDLLYDYGQGKLTKKQLIKKIKNSYLIKDEGK